MDNWTHHPVIQYVHYIIQSVLKKSMVAALGTNISKLVLFSIVLSCHFHDFKANALTGQADSTSLTQKTLTFVVFSFAALCLQFTYIILENK